MTTGRVRRWTVAAGPTLALMGVVALAQLWATRTADSISIVADEAGYLADARYLAGVGEAWNMGTTTYYRPGYALLLVPLFRLFDDPGTVYRAAIGVNVALATATVPLAAALARRLFGSRGLSAHAALAIGAVVALYPPTFLQSNFAWSENLFVPLFLALAVATHTLLLGTDGDARRAHWTAALVGVLAPLLLLTHGRGLGPAAVAVGALALAGARRWVPRRAALLGLGLAVAGVVAGQALNRRLVSVLFEADRGDERLVSDALERLDDVGAVLVALAGQTWYLLVASLGLAGVGVVALLDVARRIRRERRQRAPAEAVAALALLAMVLAVVVVSTLYMTDRPRADHAIYGRYNEGVLPLLLLAGLAHLATAPRRDRLVALVPAALALVASGAVLRGWRQDLLLDAPFNSVNALAVRPWRQAFDGLEVIPITALALGSMLAVGIAAGLRRRSAVLLAAVVAVSGVVHLHATFADGKSGSLAGVEEVAVVADLVDDDAVLAYARTPGIDTRFWAYQQYLPELRFTRFRADLGADPGSDLVWAPTTVELPLLAGARIAYLDPWYPVALHVLPGPRQDAMARAGRLLPAGWPSALPSPSGPGRLDLVSGPPTVDSGHLRAELRLRHGGGLPWPAVQSLPDPTGVVRIAVRVIDRGCACQVLERRVDLPRMLYAGDEASIEVDVPVDVAGGDDHEVRFELIQENIGVLPVAAVADLSS